MHLCFLGRLCMQRPILEQLSPKSLLPLRRQRLLLGFAVIDNDLQLRGHFATSCRAQCLLAAFLYNMYLVNGDS